MDAPVPYDAYLDRKLDGRWLALVLDLPGCYAAGASEREALAALTAVIPAYFAWLQIHDEYTPIVRGTAQVVPRETFTALRLGSDEVNAFFTPDAEPVDDEALDWDLALLGWAHEDLMTLARGAPPPLLDAQPPAGGRTLRQLLNHVAQAQLWYVSRLDTAPVPTAINQLPGEPVERLQRVHAACVDRLSAASDEQRTRVLVHQHERWSMRKVLRRCICHVREHTQDVARLVRLYVG